MLKHKNVFSLYMSADNSMYWNFHIETQRATKASSAKHKNIRMKFLIFDAVIEDYGKLR